MSADLEEYVTRLTDVDFDERVKEKNTEGQTQYWLINFYAPWCSHCVEATTTYKAIAEDFDGQVEFGAINCEVGA